MREFKSHLRIPGWVVELSCLIDAGDDRLYTFSSLPKHIRRFTYSDIELGPPSQFKFLLLAQFVPDRIILFDSVSHHLIFLGRIPLQ
jgi:hypothetical protein